MPVVLSLLLLACSGTPETPVPGPSAEPGATATTATATEAHAGLDARDPEACTSCHADIVSEWRESMHAHSHADEDPIYAAMRKLRMAKQGEAIGAKCQKCHNPQAPDAPDSLPGRVGVACGSCHDLAPGAESRTADGRTICMTCHDATENPAGVATCTTGPENAGAGGAPCASCHLPPAADGHPQHVFAGPHRAWLQDDPSMLAQAVTATLARTDAGVELTVTNTTGHGFPTGFPGRIAQVLLQGTGPDGDWQAAPEALSFKKVYLDADGKPVMPPFAASLGKDTRLQPGETRAATVEVPDDVTGLRAVLTFRLLPPPAAEVLGIEGALAEPRSVPLATLD